MLYVSGVSRPRLVLQNDDLIVAREPIIRLRDRFALEVSLLPDFDTNEALRSIVTQLITNPGNLHARAYFETTDELVAVYKRVDDALLTHNTDHNPRDRLSGNFRRAFTPAVVVVVSASPGLAHMPRSGPDPNLA